MSTSVPMRFEDTPLLWTAAGIYSESECARICEDIAAASPSLATNNPMYRNQDRVMRDDPETTELQGAAFDVSASDEDSE